MTIFITFSIDLHGKLVTFFRSLFTILQVLPSEAVKEIDSKTDEEILNECNDDSEYVKNFKPHESCWKLDARGSVGETALHLLILHSTPLHNEIAKILLNMYPKLALDFYEGEEYYGRKEVHVRICTIYIHVFTFTLLATFHYCFFPKSNSVIKPRE